MVVSEPGAGTGVYLPEQRTENIREDGGTLSFDSDFVKTEWGRKPTGRGKSGEFACFCVSPQLTFVLTKLIARALFAK